MSIIAAAVVDLAAAIADTPGLALTSPASIRFRRIVADRAQASRMGPVSIFKFAAVELRANGIDTKHLGENW